MTTSPAGEVISVEELPLPALDVLSEAFAADPTGQLRRLLADGHAMARSHRGVELLTYQWVADLLNDPRFHTVDTRHFAQKGSPPALLAFVQDGLLLSMDAGASRPGTSRPGPGLHPAPSGTPAGHDARGGRCPGRQVLGAGNRRPGRRVHRSLPDGDPLPGYRSPHLRDSNSF